MSYLVKFILVGLVVCSTGNLLSMMASKAAVLEEVVSITQEELQRSDSEEVKRKFLHAAKQGFFYVELPKELTEHVEAAEEFAHECYSNEELRAKEVPGITGFHEFGQVEALLCEQPYWRVMHPKKVQQLATSLIGLSEDIFRIVFSLVAPQLPQKRWEEAIGSYFEDHTHYGFSFNHFRPEKETIGYPAHYDIGYVSLLFITKKGLYARINGNWRPMLPKPGYVVVNFGKAFELLVNDPAKLSAVWHVVEQISSEKHGGDRISFGLFSNNTVDAPVMKVLEDGMLEELHPRYTEYVVSEIASIKANTVDLPNFEEIEAGIEHFIKQYVAAHETDMN